MIQYINELGSNSHNDTNWQILNATVISNCLARLLFLCFVYPSLLIASIIFSLFCPILFLISTVPSRTIVNIPFCLILWPIQFYFLFWILFTSVFCFLFKYNVTLIRTSTVLTLVIHFILSIFLYIHILKSSILFLSLLPIVHVLLPYKSKEEWLQLEISKIM